MESAKAAEDSRYVSVPPNGVVWVRAIGDWVVFCSLHFEKSRRYVEVGAKAQMGWPYKDEHHWRSRKRTQRTQRFEFHLLRVFVANVVVLVLRNLYLGDVVA